MSETNVNPLASGPADALKDGAERFDRLIETVRAQRAAPANAPAAPGPNPLLVEGPEEIWARNFRTEAIGPRPTGAPRADRAFLSAAALFPETPIVPTQAMQVLPERLTAPLGTQIGKPERRQSWFGRLLRPARG